MSNQKETLTIGHILEMSGIDQNGIACVPDLWHPNYGELEILAIFVASYCMDVRAFDGTELVAITVAEHTNIDQGIVGIEDCRLLLKPVPPKISLVHAGVFIDYKLLGYNVFKWPNTIVREE